MVREGTIGGGQPSLAQMLSEDTVALRVSVSNWEEAVRAAGALLVRSGAVEPRYVEAMIQMVKEIGPYIVIAPGVALPHARPEEGALRPCMSALTLSPAINFGNVHNDPVSLVIAFAAPDAEGHVGALAELARVLEDAEVLERLKSASSVHEFLSLMCRSKSARQP